MLQDDLNAQGTTDKWLENFELSKNERTAIQEPYKGLCQKMCTASIAHNRLEDFSFSSSFHILNELRGDYILDKKMQEDAFFMGVFHDLLTFKRHKGKMILAGLYNTRDYFLSNVNYPEIFIETYRSLLMLSEMRRTPQPTLVTIKSNISVRIVRDFDPTVFSKSQVEKIQESTAQQVEEWFKNQQEFKELGLPSTSTHLSEISEWTNIPLMGVSLGKAHLMQFRDFVQNLSAELDAHLKLVRDLLKGGVLSFNGIAPGVFDFSIDELKRSLSFPSIFEDISFKGPVNRVLKAEIGITNYAVVGTTSAEQGVVGTRLFYIENTEYQIFPEMVRTFRDFVWPLIPRNVRIDDLTKPDYVPLYSYFGQAEMNALHAQINAMQQEITKLRGTISDQAILVKGAKAQKAAEEAQKVADALLASEGGAKSASKPKAKSKKSASNGVAGPGSDVSEKVVPDSTQSASSLEALTKMTENLRKELGTKDKALDALKKQRDQEHQQLNARLCQLSGMEVSESSALEDVLDSMTLKWKSLKETIIEQEARLKEQTTRLEVLSRSSEKPNKELERRLTQLQSSLQTQSQELDRLKDGARKYEKEKADYTRDCILEIARATGLKSKEGASLQDVSLQMKSQLGSLRKIIEDQKRDLVEKEALFQKASLQEKAQEELTRKMQSLEKSLEEKSAALKTSEKRLRVLEQEQGCYLALKKHLSDLVGGEDAASTLDILVEKLRAKLEDLQTSHVQTESLKVQRSEFSKKEKKFSAKIAQLEETVHRVSQENLVFQKDTQDKAQLLKAQALSIETLTEQNDKNQSALQFQVAAHTAELSVLKQRASHPVSEETFKSIQGQIYELTGEIMRFISDIMSGTTPVDVSKLEGNLSRLHSVYWRENQMLPPGRHVVQSPYPPMMRHGYPSGPIGQNPHGYQSMNPYPVGYRGSSFY